MILYHNPRCSKSRQALQLLESKNIPVEIVLYLKNIPTKKELQVVIDQLGIQPIELVRKNEPIWKENYKGKTLSNNAIINAMVEHPKLIERPIAIHNNKAILGRPPGNILTLF